MFTNFPIVYFILLEVVFGKKPDWFVILVEHYVLEFEQVVTNDLDAFLAAVPDHQLAYVVLGVTIEIAISRYVNCGVADYKTQGV